MSILRKMRSNHERGKVSLGSPPPSGTFVKLLYVRPPSWGIRLSQDEVQCTPPVIELRDKNLEPGWGNAAAEPGEVLY